MNGVGVFGVSREIHAKADLYLKKGTMSRFLSGFAEFFAFERLCCACINRQIQLYAQNCVRMSG